MPGFIEAEASVCIYGPPNSGKTFVTLEFVVRMLENGFRGLFFEEEGSPKGIQERYNRAALAHELTPEQDDGLRVWHNVGVNLTAEATVKLIIAHALEHQADFIVLDSLAAMSGGLDENDSSVQGPLANMIHRIKVETGATVIVLHHMTKEGWTPGMKPTLRTLRGHSALPGRLDTAIAIIQDEERSNANELCFEIHETKRREGFKNTDPKRCSIVMPAGGPAATCRITAADANSANGGAHSSDSADNRKVAAIRNALLVAVADEGAEGITSTDLRKSVKGRTELVTRAIRELTDEGKLVRNDDKKLVLPTADGTKTNGVRSPSPFDPVPEN